MGFQRDFRSRDDFRSAAGQNGVNERADEIVVAAAVMVGNRRGRDCDFLRFPGQIRITAKRFAVSVQFAERANTVVRRSPYLEQPARVKTAVAPLSNSILTT